MKEEVRGVGADPREPLLEPESGVGDGGQRERAPRHSGHYDEDDVGHEGAGVLLPGDGHAARSAVLRMRIHPRS